MWVFLLPCGVGRVRHGFGHEATVIFVAGGAMVDKLTTVRRSNVPNRPLDGPPSLQKSNGSLLVFLGIAG